METDNPFEKTLDRLREKGWHKNFYGNMNTGPNCLAGAALAVGAFDHGVWGRHPNCKLLDSIVYTEYKMHSIPSFNDHLDTTFSDIERVLEKAAVKWEEERVLRDD